MFRFMLLCLLYLVNRLKTTWLVNYILHLCTLPHVVWNSSLVLCIVFCRQLLGYIVTSPIIGRTLTLTIEVIDLVSSVCMSVIQGSHKGSHLTRAKPIYPILTHQGGCGHEISVCVCVSIHHDKRNLG